MNALYYSTKGVEFHEVSLEVTAPKVFASNLARGHEESTDIDEDLQPSLGVLSNTYQNFSTYLDSILHRF